MRQPASHLKISQTDLLRTSIFYFNCFGLIFRGTCSDGDLHSIFHWILEGDLDSE